MKTVLAIAVQTARSSIRSRVFHVLLLLVLLAVFALPLTLSGDGTAAGLVQISLTYSLGTVIVLLSAATLWLSCNVLAKEIETHNIHMVVTKPCPSYAVWAGKWLGVFVMHTVILAIGGVIIFCLIQVRLAKSDFPEEEKTRLRNEIMVGRQAFLPLRPDFKKHAAERYKELLAAGELDPDHIPGVVQYELLRQVKARYTEVAPEETRFWIFTGIPRIEDTKMVFFRYRYYAGVVKTTMQEMVKGIWGVRDPGAEDDTTFAVTPQETFSATFHEIPLLSSAVDENGELIVSYMNVENGKKSVVFQRNDGPTLLVPAVGFAANYLRSMTLSIFLIAFLAALGCTAGAAFSSPVATFVAASYLVVGLVVQSAVDVPPKNDIGQYIYKDTFDRLTHYVARGVSHVVVSMKDLDATPSLTRGHLIQIYRLGKEFTQTVVLRGGLLAALGVWVLSRREFGAVVRR